MSTTCGSQHPAIMSRDVIAALGLIGLGLLGGCGGGDVALSTVPTAHLAVTLPATTVVVGTPFSFTVTALDATNTPVPTYIGTVQITTSDKSAVLPANATLARGVGTFTLTFTTPGSQTITATDTVGDATSGTSAAIAVTPIPAPTATSMSPTKAVSGGPGFTLTVNGSNLVSGSVVQWNGGNRPTVFVNSSQVTAQISAADIAMDGSAVVTVFNPAPGGGRSNALTFTITICAAGPQAIAPQSIAVDPTGKFAYVAGSCTDLSARGYVSMYTINPTTGALASIGPRVASLDEGAQSMTVDPLGRFAYVANWGAGDTAGSVSMYTINATTGALTSIGAVNGACNNNPECIAPWSVAVDPSGRFAYVANEGGFAPTDVSMFTINATTGTLTDGGAITAGGRAVSVAVDPSGKFAYVVAENSGSSGDNISIYKIDTTTGILTSTGSTIAGYSIVVHPSGKFAYVNTDPNEISTYSINGTTGALTSIGTLAGGALYVIHPSGKFAYGTNSGTASIYTIDTTTGALTFAGTTGAGSTSVPVAIHPSGKFAYGFVGSNSISMFSIDAATGLLTLIGTIST